jgi:hypothetical protein
VVEVVDLEIQEMLKDSLVVLVVVKVHKELELLEMV